MTYTATPPVVTVDGRRIDVEHDASAQSIRVYVPTTIDLGQDYILLTPSDARQVATSLNAAASACERRRPDAT